MDDSIPGVSGINSGTSGTITIDSDSNSAVCSGSDSGEQEKEVRSLCSTCCKHLNHRNMQRTISSAAFASEKGSLLTSTFGEHQDNIICKPLLC